MAVGLERLPNQATFRIDQPPILPSHLSNRMSYNNPLGFSSTGVAGPQANVPSTQNITDSGRADSTSQTAAPSSHAQTHSHSVKKRRPSKVKVPPEIRRSASQPHMRNLALGTTGELSPTTADKRRNKLGYHRTSVACGHCRRRKIRCLLAPDDPHGRCSNCIRLKKECNFYPVEQTNPAEQRAPGQNVAADAGSNPPSVSTTSSPRHSAPSSNDQSDEYRQYAAMPPTPVEASHAQHGLPMQQPQYAYGHSGENQWASPGYLAQSSVAESSPSSSGYWRPSPSTAPSTYGSESNFSGGQTPATMSTAPSISYGAPHEGWAQPPTRSMSYGNIEGLPQYPNQVLPSQRDHRSNTSPYPYPPPLETQSSRVQSTSIGDSSSGPLSAPIMAPPVQHPYGYQPSWNNYTMHSAGPDIPMQGRSMSAQWYAEPTPLGQVQEEGPPPMAFNHGMHNNMQQFYSGP